MRIIVKSNGLGIIGVNDNCLAAGLFVDGVAGDGLHLCRYHSTNNTGNSDLAVFIGLVQAIG